MANETIDEITLTQLASSGEVRSARAVGQGCGWNIQFMHGFDERTLVTKPCGDARIFDNLETLVAYLNGVGIRRFDVDAENFASSARPTQSEQPAATNAASVTSYDKSFDAEVQASIDDPDPGVPHDEAMRRIEAAIFAD